MSKFDEFLQRELNLNIVDGPLSWPCVNCGAEVYGLCLACDKEEIEAEKREKQEEELW